MGDPRTYHEEEAPGMKLAGPSDLANRFGKVDLVDLAHV
jgi:hypothetical protein